MNMRVVFTSIISVLLLSGCSDTGIDKSTELGITVCGQVAVLDQFMQEKNQTVDYQAILQDIYDAADKAVVYDSDKFGQLSLLVNRMKDSIERGDRKVILDLVAVEGECQNLGYM
jgi:outer membrane murein-binding lipoprotein Lpp